MNAELNGDWIEVNISWDQLLKSGVIVAGSLLEMADGEILLVGDVNVKGGWCECCSIRGDIVARYKLPKTTENETIGALNEFTSHWQS